MKKPASDLTEADCRAFPLWRFTLEELPGEDETWVTPVQASPNSHPGDDLACVATEFLLADGTKVFGLTSAPSGVKAVDDQTMRISVFVHGLQVHLAGYYDLDFDNCLTPTEFASAMGRSVEKVFPISYDVSAYFDEPAEKWRGQIFERAPNPLTEDELIDLVVGHTE